MKSLPLDGLRRRIARHLGVQRRMAMLNVAILDVQRRMPPRPGAADHHLDCDWQFEQYDFECVCGAARPRAVWFQAYLDSKTAPTTAPSLGRHPENVWSSELLGPQGRVMTRDLR